VRVAITGNWWLFPVRKEVSARAAVPAAQVYVSISSLFFVAEVATHLVLLNNSENYFDEI
jgi:hypothetical protein